MKNIHETINNSIAAAKKMKSIEDWINKLSYKEQHYMETIIFENNYAMKVVYDIEEFSCFMVEDDERILFMGRNASYEVIGNIYENPELLEEIK